MSSRTATLPLALRSVPFRAGLATTAVGGALILAGLLVAQPAGIRFVIAAAALLLAAGIGFLSANRLLYALVVWLAALGLVRRLLTQIAPAGDADPLLVVGPFAVLVLLVLAHDRGAFANLTALAKAVVALTAFALVGAVNPLQGSIVAGLAGLLFVIAPTLAFWVGRAVDEDRVMRGILKLVAVAGLGIAAYGLWQTFEGLPSWDSEWVRASGYEALNVSGAVRAFGSFASSQEYTYFLAIALVAWLAFGLRLPWLPLTVAAVGVIGTALVYASGRGTIFTLVLALAVMACARLRLPALAVIAVAAVAIVAVTIGASSLAPEALRSQEQASSDPERLLAHQLSGLADPLDPDSSTLGLHFELFLNGVRGSLAEPFGQGLGVVSRAGEKFGDVQLSTEIDPSNLAVAAGIPGLVLYLVVMVLAFRSAYRLAVGRHDALSILALGVLTITVFQWMNGGLYAVSTLTWLVLGWVDRRSSEGPPARRWPDG